MIIVDNYFQFMVKYRKFNIKEKKQFPLYSVTLILGMTIEQGGFSRSLSLIQEIEQVFLGTYCVHGVLLT